MKDIFKDSETFGLYAQIDCCYYMLKEIQFRLGLKPLSAIEQMIQDCTGYRNKRTEIFRKNAIDLLKQIIDCKKKIEVDYSNDEKFLNELKKLTDKT